MARKSIRQPGPARRLDFGHMFESARLDKSSSNSLFYQVFLAVREKILGNALVDGDLLPSEAQLIRFFGVSRITARRSIRELVAAGLAKSRQGVGTVVSFKGVRHRQRGSIEDLLDNLLVIGKTTQVKVISLEFVPASATVAAALRVDPGAKVQRTVRVRYEESHPLSLIEAYIPFPIGRRISRSALESESLQNLLQRKGVDVARAEQTLSACSALGQDAKLLGVEPGAPLFRIIRTVYDSKDVPVELVTALYRSDRYEYQMSLIQSKGRWKRG